MSHMHDAELANSTPGLVLPITGSNSSDQAGNNQHEVTLFGLTITNTTMTHAVDWIVRRAQHGHKTLLNFVNAHCLNTACTHPAYRRVLEQSTRLLPDGSGVKLALRFQGKELIENLNGTDLFPHLCAAAARHGLSLYLLGGQPGIAGRVGENMVRRYPQLRIAGSRDGYFSNAQNDAVIAEINRSGADILLVAMGVPRQELWLSQNMDRLQSPINMGVGGLFDFYSERISRAPLWLRRMGMEWTWRLLQEPGRMWRRYLLGNPVFVLRALHNAMTRPRELTPYTGLKRGNFRASVRKLHWWLSNKTTSVSKRTLDIIGAGLGLLLVSPLMLLTALAIRLESPGPVFFSQQRVGLRGRQFRLWKFRSMYTDAEARRAALISHNEMDGGVLFKIKDDPRVTRVGHVIRRFSIDELPQLWNVLRGDMALVGPRPALPDEVAQYRLADRQRLLVRPGITCIWQVSGRSNIPFERQVEMDLKYMHTATLKTDLHLLLKTVPAVISGHGAC